MNIVVYGGSFDPVHLGHLTVANEVYHQLQPDLFLFIPAGHSPLKTSHANASSASRVEMLHQATDYLGFGSVESYEIEHAGKSYTYHTMCYLKEKYPEAEISLIIGTDQYNALDKWYEIDKLKSMVTFIVVNRETAAMKLNPPFQSITIPRMDISSTMIRERIARDETIKCLVIDTIERFIRKEHLYETKKSNETGRREVTEEKI